MTARLLTTSIGILLLALVFSFPAVAKNWSQNDEVTIYGGKGITNEGWAILVINYYTNALPQPHILQSSSGSQ